MSFDGDGVEILSRDDCLALLAAVGLGRVAISVGALPAILPVRFVLDQGEIVFRASPGNILDAATRGAVVAFEADGMDTDDRIWSVLATGFARHLAPQDGRRPPGLALRPWSAEGQDRLVAIVPEIMSGRRAHHVYS